MSYFTDHEQKVLVLIMSVLLAGCLIRLLANQLPMLHHPALPPTASRYHEVTVFNLNEATVEQLQSLPGIGATIANRIIKRREEIGSFISVEQLLEVKGVSQKTYRQIYFRLMV